MRNKIIVLFFIFISSCQNFSINENVQNYEKEGFAEISNGEQTIHHTIVANSQIRITNLLNKKNIIVNIDKNSNLPLVKIETLRTNKTFSAKPGQIYEEEKKIAQNIDLKNVDIIDLSKNKQTLDTKLKKIIIFYGDFIYKNSAQDMVSLLKKEISSVNPAIVHVNKKYRVKAKTINDINDFDIFFDKIVNTKFENYNISVE